MLVVFRPADWNRNTMKLLAGRYSRPRPRYGVVAALFVQILSNGIALSLRAAILSAVFAAAAAAGPGKIVGRILDDKNDKPLAYANVVIVGTAWGAMSQADGSFTISPVPPGDYEVQTSYLGYETERKPAKVTEDGTVTLVFSLKGSAIKTKEITIKADRPLVDVKRASTVRSFNADELKSMALQPTLDSVVEQVPGVTKDNGELHIRGGRAEETLYIVDGVRTRDLLSGASKGNMINSRSVAEVNIITGGFDAKYGQALSGIVEAKLKEGTDTFHGYIGTVTDRWIDTQDNDYYNFQVSGPLSIMPKLTKLLGGGDSKQTFFLDLSTNLRNGYLPSIADLPGKKRLKSSYTERIAGRNLTYNDFFYPRANNDWRLLFKTSWRPTKSDKIDFSFTKSLDFNEGFGDVEISSINRNITNYPWSWAHRFDHYYTVSDEQNSLSMIWNRGVTRNLVHALTVTRFFSSNHKDVAGRPFTSYDTVTDAESYDAENPDPDPYFRNLGDALDYSDRYVKTWNFASDWTWTRSKHKLDAGWSHQFEDVQYLTLNAATVDSVKKPLGDEFDLFHVYPTSGALYLQDRAEYESLIAGVGLRYDYWFPGKQVENLYENWATLGRPTITEETAREFRGNTRSIFGRRFKGHLSPRLQISFPITGQDNLFFNFGHFSQRPPYYYVYSKIGSQSSEEYPRIGNPNLNPEISVQYELGVGHTFRPDLASKVSLFYKDIYDYPTSETITLGERQTSRSNFFIYLNRDYARSTGVEIEIRKKRLGHWSGAVAYTYSQAKGKSSDPNTLKLVQESGGDSRETALGEVYMWWNRPHKFTVWYSYGVNKGEHARPMGFRLPDDWGFSVYTLLQSGKAYQPRTILGAYVGQENSKNGPFETTTNVKLTKGLRVMGLKMEGTFEVFNLFNHREALTFDPATGRAYVPGQGSLYLYDPHMPGYILDPNSLGDPNYVLQSDWNLLQSFGQPVRVGATPAEVHREAEQVRRSITETLIAYSNPAYRAAPRSMRFGIGIEW
jgi:outer membrane receptor protein involved in Fe transport